MVGFGALPLAVEYVPRLLWASLPLVLALLLGAVVIHLVDKWRKRVKTENLTPNDQLSHFRQLYEQGLLTPEEFARIRSRLGGELRRELQLPELPVAELDPTTPPQDGFQTETPPSRQEPPETGIRPA
jgi:hypothetical protein